MEDYQDKTMPDAPIKMMDQVDLDARDRSGSALIGPAWTATDRCVAARRVRPRPGQRWLASKIDVRKFRKNAVSDARKVEFNGRSTTRLSSMTDERDAVSVLTIEASALTVTV